MSMSNIVDGYPKIIATCENHKDGNGRECEWGCDSEYYSQNTLKTNVTTTNGSH